MDVEQNTELLDRIPVTNNHTVVVQTGSELQISLPARAKSVNLNNSMSLIWRLCDGERTIGDICAALEEVYPESSGDIALHVKQAIGVLEENKIIALK